MPLDAGATLSHYRVLGKLGAGGMGEVYLAEDTRLARKVAIKILPAAFSSNPDRLQRFVREARATSALNHPNIAQIHEIGTDRGYDYLVLEYVEGETLTRHAAAGPLPVPQVVDLAVQLAGALEDAHAHGIVHRDLKPDNILVTPRGQAKVLDFGLAKMEHTEIAPDATRTESVTAEGMVIGTVEFMSPEQAMGREVDRRTDFFSLGVVLYRLAGGHLPFSCRTPTETLGRIMHVPPAPLQLEGSAGAKLARIILKCLQKDPAERYQSATALLADLAALQREIRFGKAARPVRSSTARRIPKRIAWIAVAVATLALGAAAYWKTTQKSDPWIAVLPFANATGDSRLEYLAQGLTESLIDDLSQVPHLHVMSYTTVQPYRRQDPLAAAKALHSTVVLGGELRNDGGMQAVRLNLVDAATGTQIWAHQYDRTMMPLLNVQQEIAREVSRRVAPGRSPARSHKGPAFAESYDLYLKGRYAVNQRTTQAIQEGLQDLRDAIARDPSYAPALVGLARGYVNLAFTGNEPATYAFPLAMAAAEKALKADPNLADAHSELGYLKVLADYDWPAAEAEFNTAIALNPNDAQPHELYAMWVLAPMGREAKATAEIERAVSLDPQSIMVGFHRGWILWEFRHYQEAADQLQKTIAIDPRFLFSHLVLSQVLADESQFAASVAEADTPPYTPGGHSRQLTTLAYMLARAGDRGRLAPLLQEIEARLHQGYVPPFNVARIYAVMGDLNRGFRLLERAYTDRDPGLVSLKVDPTADVFRSDPRLNTLLQKMHLQ